MNAAKCGGSKQLRVATDEAERYAVVSKMLGNGMCYVRLLSGGNGTAADMLCIIRNKFKGRGKRDNILDSGSWVLVGMREWASKQDTCDLLEVYNDGERDRLLKHEPCFKGVFAAANASDGDSVVSNIRVQFTDSTTMKYSKLVKSGNKEDDDDSDSAMQVMQQRSYDMPTDDETDDETDDDDDDEDDDDEDNDESGPSEELEESKEEADVVAVKTKNKNARVDVINVDDI